MATPEGEVGTIRMSVPDKGIYIVPVEIAAQLRRAIVEVEQRGTPETRDSLMNSIAQRAFVAETQVRTGGAPAMGAGGKSRAQNVIDRRAGGLEPHAVDMALRASFSPRDDLDPAPFGIQEPSQMASAGHEPDQPSTLAGRAATAAVAAFSPPPEASEQQAGSTVTAVKLRQPSGIMARAMRASGVEPQASITGLTMSASGVMGGEVATTPITPFTPTSEAGRLALAAMDAGGIRNRPQFPTEPTGEALAKGFVRGVTLPTRVFGWSPFDVDEDALDDPNMIARTVGEVAGGLTAGVGMYFAPAVVAPSAWAAINATRMGRTAAGLATGVMFDIGRTENNEDFIRNVIEGAVIGGALGGAFEFGIPAIKNAVVGAKAIAPLEHAVVSGVESTTGKIRIPVPQMEANLTPAMVNTARNLHPITSTDYEDLLVRLLDASDPQKQGFELAADIAARSNAGGRVLMEGVERSTANDISITLQNSFGTKVALHEITDGPAKGLFNILAGDLIEMPRIAQTAVTTGKLGVVKRMLKAGQDKLTPTVEMLRVLRMNFVEPGVGLKDQLAGVSVKQMFSRGSKANVDVAVGREWDEVVRISAQYGDDVATSYAARTGVALDEGGLIGFIRSDFAPGIQGAEIRDQLGTLARISESYRVARAGGRLLPTANDSKQAIANLTAAGKLSDRELLRRGYEAMLADFTAAGRRAPTASTMLARLRNAEAVAMRKVAKSYTTHSMDDILAHKMRFQNKTIASEMADFAPEVRALTQAELSQFAKNNVFNGMPVLNRGRVRIYKGRLKDGRHELIDPRTGRVARVKSFQHLTRSSLVSVKDEATAAVTKLLTKMKAGKLPGWLSVRLEGAEGITSYAVSTAKAEIMDGVEGLAKYLRSVRGDKWTPGSLPRMMREAAESLSAEGRPLGVLNDDGRLTLLIGDESILTKGRNTGSPDLSTAAGAVGDKVLPVSFRDLADDLLLGNGISERELPYWREAFANVVRQSSIEGLEEGTIDAFEFAARQMPDIEFVEDLARARGVAMERTDDLSYRMLIGDEKAPGGTFGDRDAARDAVNQMEGVNREVDTPTPDHQAAKKAQGRPPPDQKPGHTGSPDDVRQDGNLDGTSGSGGLGGSADMGGVQPPKHNSTPEGSSMQGAGWMGRFIDRTRTAAPWLTPVRSLAKSIQRQGKGRFLDIVDSSHQARLRMKRAYAERTLLPGLGGKSVDEQLTLIDRLINGRGVRTPVRKEIITKHIEAMNPDELIRPGGLTQRGLTTEEIRMAKELSGRGLQPDVARIIGLNRMAKRYSKDAEQFLARYDDAIRGGKITDAETVALYESLKEQATQGVTMTREQALEAMGLSAERRWLADAVNGTKANPDEFLWENAGRLALSYDQGMVEGMKQTGKEFTAAKHSMTPREIRGSDEIAKLYDNLFPITGVEPERFIGGYMPHYRQYSEAGLGSQYAFPQEVRQFIHKKLRTGEIEAWMADPTVGAAKYTHAVMSQAKHFGGESVEETLTAGVKTAKAMAEAGNVREGGWLAAYVNELRGRPHGSMNQMNDSLGRVMHAISGGKIGEAEGAVLANQLIDTMSEAMYLSAIPFRPGLILRNAFQTMIFTYPRVGAADWAYGLRAAMTREGRDAAVRAGAMAPQRAQFYRAQTQAIRGLETGLKATHMLKKLGAPGFRLYQAPDDVGRALAYHAFKRRSARAFSQFQQHGDEIKFFKQSKLYTFSEGEQEMAIRAFREKGIEGYSDVLGRTAAGDSHLRYGDAQHPLGWDGSAGRMFGHFGTWPIQYANYMGDMMSQGTMADKVGFLMRWGTVNTAVSAAGIAAGYNLMGWMTFPSLTFMGGPNVDFGIDMYQMVAGSPQERQLARRSMGFRFPKFEDPRSLYVPLTYQMHDWGKLLSGDIPGGLGIKEYEQTTTTAFDMLLDPTVPVANFLDEMVGP